MPFGIGFWANGARAATGAFDLLETTVLTGSQASVEFTNLTSKYASTYQHLQIRMVARTNRAATLDYLRVFFNGVKTNGNYKAHFLGGNGSTVFSGEFGESNVLGIQPGITANSDPANAFGVMVMDILDPFETTKNKTIRAMTGDPAGDFSHVGLASGVFLQTATTTSLEIAPWFGTSFVQGSRFSLYGLRAS